MRYLRLTIRESWRVAYLARKHGNFDEKREEVLERERERESRREKQRNKEIRRRKRGLCGALVLWGLWLPDYFFLFVMMKMMMPMMFGASCNRYEKGERGKGSNKTIYR